MNNFIDYLFGNNVSVDGLSNAFMGVVKADLYDEKGNKHLIHAGNVSNGKFEIILPDYEKIKDLLWTQYFTSPGIDNPGISASRNAFVALSIFDSKENLYDQAVCTFSTKGLEDTIFFYYSNQEVKIVEKHRNETVVDGEKYTRIWDADFKFKIGWNLVWEHKTLTDQSVCITRQRKTDLEHIPQSIRWECLNHKGNGENKFASTKYRIGREMDYI
jgi:hypothetical protein